MLIAVGILTHFKKDTYSAKSVIKDTISLIAIFQFILTFGAVFTNGKRVPERVGFLNIL